MSMEKILFNSSPNPTIGVEAELYTVSNQDFNLCSTAPLILNEFKEDIRVTEELLECIVEVNTGICDNISMVRDDLVKKIYDVNQIAEKYDTSLVSMGTHPFARWKDQNITDSDRYTNFLERMQWPVRRLIISGLHVHIGVESGEKAIAITNGLTRYIPVLIGLSANSPYFDGEETGLVSTRTKIFEGLPTTGLPPLLKNYSEFQKFMGTLQKANTIQSIREVWWDIRPHPGFGTVEIRVCDAVPTITEMVALAALIQCLVVGLSDHYDDGSQLDVLDPWIISENKWRATRYGLDADIIINEQGEMDSLRNNINNTIKKLSPLAKRLGCEEEILSLLDIVKYNNAPYVRQINDYKQYNDYTNIIKNHISCLEEELMINDK